MGDLRPLGSEKLQGMDKLRRIMEIATYNEAPKATLNENYTIELADGYTYTIDKEKNGYVIKKGLNESATDYLEPMKGRKYYRSYSEAMKRLNLTAAEINRLHGNEEGIALIGEQAQKKKFILKVKKGNKTPDVGSDDMSVPTPPAPPMDEPTPAPPVDDTMTPAPPMDEPTDMGAETPPMDEPTDMGAETPTPTGEDQPSDDMEPSGDDFDLGGDKEEGQDQQGPSFKSIQRLVGKLSQRIRVIEKEKGMESDDMKYVLNSILSAMDLDKLDEDDREDILSNFDEDESEYGAEGPGELDFSDDEDFDLGDEETTEPVEPSMEKEPKENYMGIYSESTVDKVLSKYFEVSENEKPLLEEKRKRDYINEMTKKVKVKSEIRKMSESLQQFDSSLKLFNEGANFVGKTNKENLVFIKNGKQIKVDQRGRII
jgi:hypothetical protein